MARKDADASKIEQEFEKKEIERLLGDIQTKISKVPQSVITGSHGQAVSFKEAASKAYSFIRSKRQTFKQAQDIASSLDRFFLTL